MSMHHVLVTFTEALQQKLVAPYSLAWRMKETHHSKQITLSIGVYKFELCCESKF